MRDWYLDERCCRTVRRIGRRARPGAAPLLASTTTNIKAMSPTQTSITRRAISEISEGPCRAILDPLGFRRSAPHFWRLVDGLSQCVNFQSSAWGSRQAGRFTINLGVSSPALFEAFIGRSFPKVPAAALWPVSARIGFVMPTQRDLWWEVDESTDIAKLGAEVADTLHDYAVPWLQSLATRKELVHAFEDRSASLGGVFSAQVPLVLAIFAAEDGDSTRARSILGSALDDSRGKPFEKTVRRVADRLAIALDPS